MAPVLLPSHLYLSLQGKDKDSNYFEPLFEITVGAEQTIELIEINLDYQSTVLIMKLKGQCRYFDQGVQR